MTILRFMSRMRAIEDEEVRDERALDYYSGGIQGTVGWTGYYPGVCDRIFYAIILFVDTDHITGVM